MFSTQFDLVTEQGNRFHQLDTIEEIITDNAEFVELTEDKTKRGVFKYGIVRRMEAYSPYPFTVKVLSDRKSNYKDFSRTKTYFGIGGEE